MYRKCWKNNRKRFFDSMSFGILIVVWGIFGTGASSLCAQVNTSDIPTETGLKDLPTENATDSSMRATSKNLSDDLGLDGHRKEHALSEAPFDYSTLYDFPEKLKRLDRKAPIWVTLDRKKVVLGGKVCLREGSLEFFACRVGSKEHESIVALDVSPHLIHAALLAVGARQGTPAKFDPVFVPPTGDEIEIEALWREHNSDSISRVRAQDWVCEEISGKLMSTTWVFTGGLFGVDADGKKYYLANVTGEVFGLSNFPGSVLDVPFESSSDNSELYYAANTDSIPEIGTNVILVLSRAEKTNRETPSRSHVK